MSGEGQASVWVAAEAAGRLAEVVRHAAAESPVWRERLQAAGIDPAAVRTPADLRALPVLRKENLGPLQATGRPFGGLLGVPLHQLQRIFYSAGDIYDPQGPGADFWRFSTALAAAGFGPGDVVMNCASYHLSPLGFIFDAAARAAGCVVIPAGVGQQDLQVRILAEAGVTGFLGLPSYLLALLEKAAAEGHTLQLRKAFVAAEPLPPSLRERLQSFGVDVYQGYGTADLGLVAYECGTKTGMHLDPEVVVEICDPDGNPVPWGEVGEVVVTLLDPAYPLLRFGTGDLSAFMAPGCDCSREAPRIKGWLGRRGDAVKVRGIFLYPRQVEEALAPMAGQLARWRAVVDRGPDHVDRLTIEVEAAPGAAPDPEAVAAAVRAATRLRAEVSLVPPGSIPEGARRLEDRREWK